MIAFFKKILHFEKYGREKGKKMQKLPCFQSLPPRVLFEIKRICISRGKELKNVSEVRLRAFGKSEIRIGTEKIRLFLTVSEKEIEDCLLKLSEGSRYACRDSIANGYIASFGGVRVGVSGTARYDGGSLVGVGEISSLVFRIPTEESEIKSELISAFGKSSRGLLIYSSPGLGKTTALRSLVGYLGSEGGLEVCVIDERLEFLPSDYKNSSVDILRGYNRSLGMQIALRVMSPDVIVIDELGGEEETLEILSSVNAGVKIVATAHARSIEELMKRKNIMPLIESEAFDVFFGIGYEGGGRCVKTDVIGI